MKKAIAALVLLQASLAVNATTVTVTGTGVDRESAKKDAFRTAIETVCGTQVLSDREHINNRTTLNKITTYSSCRVETYTILEESENRLKLRVELKRDNISQRLKPQSENRYAVDNKNLRAQLATSKDEFTHNQQF